MSAKQYAVYKGLQKPLVYKGFKGKYIYWGIGFLLTGLVAGALIMAMVSKTIGALVMVAIMVGGIYYTAGKQKKGLHNKTRSVGVFIYPSKLQNNQNYGKKDRV